MKKLNINGTLDPVLRDNLLRVQEAMDGTIIKQGEWKFHTITFDSAVTNYKFNHGLGFKPLDIIQTAVSGAGSVTWNYDKFTVTQLDLTTTGACTVRFFVGRVKE